MVIFDGHSQLDNLLQKPLRYHHHRENYIQSLREGVIATGLKLKKSLQLIIFLTDLKFNGTKCYMMQKKG